MATDTINITVKINGTDRTSSIQRGLTKTDERNQATDTLSFTVLWVKTGDYKPTIGDEEEMWDGVTKIYGGVITKIDLESPDENRVLYKVGAKDYTHTLDRQVFVEAFADTTVGDIIRSLQQKYAQSFTTTNVSCTIPVDSIAFDNKTFSDALEQLAQLTNYSWYVDYDKDIHFFAVGTENAPYDLTRGDGNHITGSLKISEDITQLRNRVKIRGGEAEGNVVTEKPQVTEARDTTNGVIYDLRSKFSKMPTVKVNGVEQTVGVEFLSDEASFECFWSYQQKYIRFKDTTKPSGSDTIGITGKPLYPILVQVSESDSINEFGVYEFYKEDDSIKTREDAIRRAQAELEAYASQLYEGSFRTYRSGFRSGQKINVNLLGVNEDFVIQSVRFKMLTPTLGEWHVRLATLRKITIIAFLQYLLEKSGREIETSTEGSLLTFQQYADSISFSETFDSTPTVTNPPYYIAPANPANDIPGKNYSVVNESTIST